MVAKERRMRNTDPRFDNALKGKMLCEGYTLFYSLVEKNRFLFLPKFDHASVIPCVIPCSSLVEKNRFLLRKFDHASFIPFSSLEGKNWKNKPELGGKKIGKKNTIPALYPSLA